MKVTDMNNSNGQRITDRRLVRGQGMTEYIIIVALIAIAAIAAVGAFGGVVKDQFVQMSKELAGDEGAPVTATAVTGTGATTLKEYTAN